MNRREVPLVLFALMSACASWAPPSQAQSATALNVVAVSGKQRMLSQRATKAYAQIVLGVMPEKSTVILASTIDELRTANALLLGQAKTALEQDLQNQAALISKMALAVGGVVSAKGLPQVIAISEELLINAELVTQGFIKTNGNAPAALVNLAARQRMLSQRAAAAYLAYQTEARSPELKARATTALDQFKAALSAFEDAKVEFPAIADRIELAKMQSVFFDNALSNIDSPRKEQFTTIATTSERMLSEMDLLTTEIVKQLSIRNAPAAKKP